MSEEQTAKAYADQLKNLFGPAIQLLNEAREKGYLVNFQIGEKDGKVQVLGVQVDRLQRLVS